MLLALVLALPLAASTHGQTMDWGMPRGIERETGPLLDKVVVLGASLSDGFGLKPELKASVKLGDFIACSLDRERGSITTFADSSFFLAPQTRGRKLAESALETEPTLLVALDFLFWYAYGADKRDNARLSSLETGLALLERFECPMVLATIPDMHIALEGKGFLGGPMLTPSQIPSPSTLAQLNQRLLEWTRERPDTVLVPLGLYLETVLAGKSFQVWENSWEGGTDQLLQPDLLHPTVEGTAALWLLAQHGLRAQLGLDPSHFEWSSEELRQRLVEATADEREEALERERKREERKRKSRERREKEEAEREFALGAR